MCNTSNPTAATRTMRIPFPGCSCVPMVPPVMSTHSKYMAKKKLRVGRNTQRSSTPSLPLLEGGKLLLLLLLLLVGEGRDGG